VNKIASRYFVTRYVAHAVIFAKKIFMKLGSFQVIF